MLFSVPLVSFITCLERVS